MDRIRDMVRREPPDGDIDFDEADGDIQLAD